MTRYPNEFIGNLKNLEVLKLNNNQLEEISLSNLEHLKELNLDKNKIGICLIQEMTSL